MNNVVIRIDNICKRYRIGQRERYLALRDVLTQMLSGPLRLFRKGNGNSRTPAANSFWALKDICLDVQQGESVGLIGRNGAGKTTLLKILTRITKPTSGLAEVRGRVGSLLEVGTGFHPELTGRENVYFYGSILGMRKSEIERRFDEIVQFAGTEKFLDTPLKHYSTGMQTRLAFAVAAHLEPEILLVDEVLAVGDLEFQKKCLGKMKEVSQGGRTVVFVSHQMNQIRRLCEKVVWLDGGQIREMGATAEVVGAYECAMTSQQDGHQRGQDTPNVKARFLSWEIAEPRADNPHLLNSLGPVAVKFVVKVNHPIRDGHHGVALFNHQNELMWAWAANHLQLESGDHEFSYTFPMLPLRPGVYFWHVSLYDEGNLLDVWLCLPEMLIATEAHQHPLDNWNGILNVPFVFKSTHFQVDSKG
jgi:lipopolysaccharide transport system ATP-binding protein